MSKILKILIAEDEAMMAMLLKLSLQQLGHLVCEPVATGEQAIASAVAEQPDLILMDIRLGGAMDGIEAVRQIRESYPCNVVFMSGYSDPKTRDAASELDPLAFLVKPITPDRLMRYLNLLAGE